jgi:hypothetical protein
MATKQAWAIVDGDGVIRWTWFSGQDESAEGVAVPMPMEVLAVADEIFGFADEHERGGGFAVGDEVWCPPGSASSSRWSPPSLPSVASRSKGRRPPIHGAD